MVSNIDLLPTLYEMAGFEIDPRFQGHSFSDAFSQCAAAPERDEIFACCYEGDLRIIRTDTHKLIRNLSKLREYDCPVDIDAAGHYVLQQAVGLNKVGPLELYDLASDPLETTNLALLPQHASVLQKLDEKLLAWMRQCDDPALNGPTLWPRWRKFLADRQG